MEEARKIAVPDEPKSIQDQPAPALQEAKFKLTTLKELGYQLPTGIVDGNRLCRDIVVRPFKFEQEKKINEIRKERGLTLGRMMAEVLAVICVRLGVHNFEQMGHDQRVLAILRMDMMDVLYTYLIIRHDALGDRFDARVICPNCRSEFDIVADLGDLDVSILDSDTPVNLSYIYELRDPIKVRGKDCRELKLGQVALMALDSPGMTSTLNTAMRDAAVLKGAVYGVDCFGNDAITLTDDDLDQLSLFDKAELMDLIGSNIHGPRMIIETDCERCSTHISQPIDWSYDSFFSRSSRSRRGIA